MQSKADFLKSKFGGLALEPHVIVIGSLATGDAINQLPVFAVLGPKVYFQVASIPQAVDVILKAAFVFDIKYPSAARSSWTFIQSAIYGISTDADVLSVKVNVLLSDISK